MEKRKIFYTELAYVLGMAILAIGTALMEKADFGMSMIVAPAYILHLKLVEIWPFFSFGMAEYTLQAVLLIVMMLIVGKVKKAYFFSFVTAVLYGFLLDGALALAGLLPVGGMAGRAGCYLAGMILCAWGVALLFRTYISPEAYELFVREVSAKLRMEIHRFKTIYDCASCIISIALSFAFFGWGVFEGIKLGTVFCALINGWMIGRWAGWMEKRFNFRDRLTIRSRFE